MKSIAGHLTLLGLLLGMVHAATINKKIPESGTLVNRPAVLQDSEQQPIMIDRLKRGVGTSIGVGGYGGGAYAGGYAGSSSNFGSLPVPNYAPFFFPFAYSAPNPYDINSFFNAYFNALQGYTQNLQNQIAASSSSFPRVSRGLGSDLRQLWCRLVARLQGLNPESVCSNSASGIAVTGPGYYAFASGTDNKPGESQISVSAPAGATVQHFEGPGGLTGVSVSSHQESSGQPGYNGVFTSVSSGTSNINGQTDSFHSATTGVNNNGQVSSVTVTKP